MRRCAPGSAGTVWPWRFGPPGWLWMRSSDGSRSTSASFGPHASVPPARPWEATPNAAGTIPRFMNEQRAAPAESERVGHGEVWRLLPHHVGDSERHMVLTDHLGRSAASHGPSAWWHSTNDATLLMGPSMSKLLSATAGIRAIRRPTGGGAVLVGRGVVGLDIVLPPGHSLLSQDIVEDYGWLGRVWEGALSGLGLPARCVSVVESRRLSAMHSSYGDASLSCFGLTAPYEVMVDGRKVVGLSQVRRQAGVLFSSAVHLDV